MSSSSGRSQHHRPKLKPPPRPLFSCGIFGQCTRTVLSPTTTSPPSSSSNPPPTTPHPQPSSTPPPPPPPPHLPLKSNQTHPSSSSSSSSSTSQSFTQWRFPLHHPPPETDPRPPPAHDAATPSGDLKDAFHIAELHFSSGNRLPALRLLERALVHDPSAAKATCPPEVMAGVVESVLDPATARPAAKVLLALLLAEGNRRLAMEAGAATAAVEAVSSSSASGSAGDTTAERALAALELICTVGEGAAEVRGNAGAAASLAAAAERMVGRGRECAIGVLAAIYGGDWAGEAPEEVGRAVARALQGECSARGRRKGAQLLKALQENGRLDLGENGN